VNFLRRLTLTQRLSIVFALLLAICSGTSAWLQIRSNRMHALEVVQALSRDLAQHISRNTQLMDARGLNPAAVRQLFSQLMVVNPSVEVYLLDQDGRITAHAAPANRLVRDRVNLAPVHRFLDGARLPILADDPRSAHSRKVFSAAPLQVDGREAGYVYVVLLSEDYDRLDARGAASTAVDVGLWSTGLVALLCLLAGLAAFALITRRLRRLTDAVSSFDVDGPAAALPPTVGGTDGAGKGDGEGDEIAVLDSAFRQMAARLGEQWRALMRQDQERRELIANISHDLRTPLASLHGYLETLSLKDATLQPAERRRYLGIALDQSTKVGKLAQSLFELARLEYGDVRPVLEPFSLVDLVQDVFQKFELAAQARTVRLKADFVAPIPAVRGDLGMIERVLTNLLDNALRYVPAGGEIDITLAHHVHLVQVTVSDTGPGIPPALREGLFRRPYDMAGGRRDGGLGLRIVHRILQLHGREIVLADVPGRGAAFQFTLPVEQARAAAG
jgi:signal transduction histidine kinase